MIKGNELIKKKFFFLIHIRWSLSLSPFSSPSPSYRMTCNLLHHREPDCVCQPLEPTTQTAAVSYLQLNFIIYMRSLSRSINPYGVSTEEPVHQSFRFVFFPPGFWNS